MNTHDLNHHIVKSIDEEQKRLDKIKAIRDARKKVSAAPAAAAPAEGGETTPAAV